MMASFEYNCMNKQQCSFFVRNKDWPTPCRDKIGLRLQVINVPVVMIYDNAT